MDQKTVLTDYGPAVAKAREVIGTVQEKIEQALKLCRSSTADGDECLNTGIAILLGLSASELPEEDRDIYFPLLGLLAWAKAQAPRHQRFAQIWAELRELGGPSYVSPRWKQSLKAICERYPEYEPVRFYIGGVPDKSGWEDHILTIEEARAHLTSTIGEKFLPS